MGELRFDSAGNLLPDGCDIMSMEYQEICRIPNVNPDTQLGSPVRVFGMEGYIRAIIITITKVRFSVRVLAIDGSYTTMHNIDSIYIEPRDGDRIDMGEDNYS